MVTSMKMAVFWDVTLCSLIDTDRHFSVYCPGDGGSKHVSNMAQHPRRQPSSLEVRLYQIECMSRTVLI
jgi:hypothetical protein